MTRWSRVHVAPVAALALPVCLLLAGCGSDDDQQAVASLKSQILGNNALSGSNEITSQEASCIANGAVDDLGVDTLKKYDVLDDDLEVDKKLNEVTFAAKDADRLAGVFVGCSDVEKIFEDRLVDQLAPSRPKAKAEVETCVRDAVTPEAVRGILAQSFEKTDATDYADLVERLKGCR